MKKTDGTVRINAFKQAVMNSCRKDGTLTKAVYKTANEQENRRRKLFLEGKD